MSSINTIIFDLDDTLLWDDRSVEEAFAATAQVAAKRCGVDEQALIIAVKEAAIRHYSSYETFPFTQNIGINPLEGLWANFRDTHHEMFVKLHALAPGYRYAAWRDGLAKLGVDDDELAKELAETFPKERRARPYVFSDTFEVLNQLKGQYRLGLLTNGSPDLQQEKLAGVPELAPYFDQIVISGAFGEGKPSPALFGHVLELLQTQPQEAVMVGDKLTTDIKGALGSGLHSVWINHAGHPVNPDIVPAHTITHLRELIPLLKQL